VAGVVAAGALLYVLDRYDIPSWCITKYHVLAHKVRLTLHPVVVTDEMVLTSVAGGRDMPVAVGADLRLGDTGGAWRAYRAARAARPGLGEVPRTAGTAFPDLAADAVRRADAFAADAFEVYGRGPFVLGRDFTWTRFPPVPGDVGTVWVLNRLRHFVPLTQAYLLTGKEEYRAAIARHLKEWQRENPIANSVNWADPMEASLRLSTLVWVARALAPDPDTADLFPLLMRTMYGHARFIAANLDNPRPVNNHAIFAAIGLYLFAADYPEFAESARWKGMAEGRLLEELDRQYTAGGVHRELCTGYHRSLADVYLNYLAAKARAGEPLSPHARERIGDQLAVLKAVTAPDGRIFHLGDSGEMALIDTGVPADDAVASLHLGALLLGAPGYEAAADPGAVARWNAAWVLGEDGLDRAMADLATRPPAAGDSGPLRVFPEAGWVRIDAGGLALLADLGSIGGTPELAGHDHADTSSFVLWAGGGRLVVDPGTYTYRSALRTDGVVWRDFLRSTAAHNAVTVDGRSQADPAPGDFGYLQRPAAGILFAGAEGDLVAVAGEYEAYRAEVGAAYRVFAVSGGGLLVVDWYPEAKGPHRYDGRLSFATPKVTLGDGAAAAPTGWVRWAAGPAPRLLVGSLDPPGGWVSAGYGFLEKTAQLQLLAQAEGPVARAMALGPGPAGSAPAAPEVVDAGGGFAVTATLGGRAVLVLLNPAAPGQGGELAFGEWRTDARIAVVDTASGGAAVLYGGGRVTGPDGARKARSFPVASVGGGPK
jgi:Heparinase II/III-like protein/Heparinase II/III N-terminus